jgi:hypothetical protein
MLNGLSALFALEGRTFMKHSALEAAVHRPSASIDVCRPPWARMRATTASMSSTANMTRRIPSVFTGASTGPNRIALGVWNLSSAMP